jgi:hypothetical protein
LGEDGVGPKKYETYQKKDGRFKFQIDVGIALLNHATASEWNDFNGPWPQWMRQDEFLPCKCGTCFFCLNRFTSGIFHLEKQKAITVFVQHDNKPDIQKGCIEQRVNLQCDTLLSYCKQCYRNLCHGTDEDRRFSSAEKKK